MITSARYLGSFIALIGALMAVMTGSYLLFGAPEFTFNGEPVNNPAEASRALAAAVCVLGWGLVWLILGFQLINPVAYLIPWFLTFAARFFHFLFLLGASLSIVFLPISHGQQAELGISAPVCAGAAFGASQFLRF